MINTNQKFGYHKDTPFLVEDTKTGKVAMEFNTNTKAIFSTEKNGITQPNKFMSTIHGKQYACPVPKKIFMKLADAGTSLENQKRVMLLFNKNAQQTLI